MGMVGGGESRGCIGGGDGEKVKQTKSLKEWCTSVQAATSMVDRPPTPGRLVNSGTKIAAERVSSRASRRAPEMACACMCTWWRVRTQGQEATRWVVPWDCIRTCVLDFFFLPLILSTFIPLFFSKQLHFSFSFSYLVHLSICWFINLSLFSFFISFYLLFLCLCPYLSKSLLTYIFISLFFFLPLFQFSSLLSFTHTISLYF